MLSKFILLSILSFIKVIATNSFDVNNLEEDTELAQALHMSMNLSNETDDDEELAKAIDLSFQKHIPESPYTHFFKNNAQTLNSYAQEIQDFNAGSHNNHDVHNFNKQTIVKYHSLIAQTLAMSTPDINHLTVDGVLDDFRTVLNKTLKYHQEDKEAALNQNFNNLRAHLLGSNTDGETGFDALQTIAKLNYFAKNLDGQQVGILKTSFLDNTETQGGCYPGYMGRIIQGYMQLIINMRSEY